MAANFQELIDSLKKCRTYCPWTSVQTVESFAQQMIGEAEEVRQALQNKDNINLKEELGDVLWDTLMVAHIAEDDGIFTMQDIIDGVIQKMRRRKPYVFDERRVSLPEAKKFWNDAKAKEKK